MANEDFKKRMRAIPGMDILLSQEWAAPWIERLGRDAVKRVMTGELSAIRRRLLAGADESVSPERLREVCLTALGRAERPNLRRVINATGVVIHTNLGRSLLADEAVRAMIQAARGYSNLEYNLEAGTRGQRNAHIESLLCALTGAEAGLVVNNNAGAVLLCLSALSRDAEVVVSRGELVEIGGSFRVPDIMTFSGAKLVEVGTTNRTHLEDYARAITENTSMLLKVHPSNFRIEGFTTAPEREDLAKLAHERGVLFMEDAGSGLIVDGELLGLQGETSVRECLAQGADLVTFSGDKMLGGPQIGAIVGKKSVVDRLRKYPILRTLRVDKMTLAAFETTLRLYSRGALDDIPTPAMIRRTPESMKEQAERLAASLSARVSAHVEVVPVEDAVGGGSYPERPLSGWGVMVSGNPAEGAGNSKETSPATRNRYAGHLQALLRALELPILCGAREDALILHVRTLQPGDEEALVDALAGLIPSA
ncbi:MAG: L-seryl-tRNA(Sec) selenium transferase [Synergistaceae bacterium]|nr:L-seryl-tRNA(Sec) selenium transferase [Synergistaceae bacterium]